MSNQGAGPQVLDVRRRVHFELQQYDRAIKFLESLGAPEYVKAAMVLSGRFIRPGKSCCNWAAVLGPCGRDSFRPDNSGGYCRECGHHKDCHRVEHTEAVQS